MVLALAEYPQDWDEPDFEDLHRDTIDQLAELIFVSDWNGANDLLNDHFNVKTADVYMWISDHADDGSIACCDVLNGVSLRLNVPEVAWTIVEEMAQ